MNKSKTDVVVIDWDEVQELSTKNVYEELPAGAITAAMIEKQFGIAPSSARSRLQRLEQSGKYTVGKARKGGIYIKYLVRKK